MLHDSEKNTGAGREIAATAGFMLIELLAVIAIIGILAALLLPTCSVFALWNPEPGILQHLKR
jgi:prepilin-type N-terminal cleavage/methylation domain-containing protein